MEYNALVNIKKNLKNFGINKKIINKRTKILKSNFNKIIYLSKRLGPVIPIKYKSIKDHNLMTKNFLIRRIHKNQKKIETFEKVYLLPVHFKITEKRFRKFLVNLRECL